MMKNRNIFVSLKDELRSLEKVDLIADFFKVKTKEELLSMMLEEIKHPTSEASHHFLNNILSKNLKVFDIPF